MASNYRYTSSDPDEDERRPDPVGTLGQMVAASMRGLQDNIPGVKGASDFFGGIMRGAQQFVETVPRENALLGALDVVSRPNYAVASAVDQVVKGKGTSGLLEGLGAGFTGQTKTSFSDVLENAGMGEGPRLELGPLNVSARDVAGFGLDVATDPTTYLTFGAAGAAKAGAVKAGKWGATTIAPPLTTKAITVAPFDPLSAMGRAVSIVTNVLPGGQAAKGYLRDAAGEVFEKNYALKNAGYEQVARDLERLSRAPRVYRQEADANVRDFAKRLSGFDEDQQRLFLEMADTGLDLADTDAALARQLGEYNPQLFQGRNALMADTGDEAVDTLLRYWRGEYRPYWDAIRQGLGLQSTLSDYLMHYHPQHAEDAKRLASTKRPLQMRKAKWHQRTGAEGWSQDPLVAVAAEQLDTARRRTIQDLNGLVSRTLEQHGRKLKPKDDVPEGFVEFYPKGRLSFFKADTVPDRITKEIGEVGQAVVGEDDIRDILAVGQGQRWVLPKPIADAFMKLESPKENIKLFKFLDSVQALWKGSVTTVWPGFHVRNAYSSVVLNAQAGITDYVPYLDAVKIQKAQDLKTMAVSADGKLVAAGTADAMPLEEFLREAKLGGALQTGYYGEEVTGLVDSLGQSTIPKKVLDKLNIFSAARQAGEVIENNVRLAHLLGRMRLGDTLEEAVQSCRRFLVDYGDLSDTERRLFRNVAPFYTWTRHALPNQLRIMAAEPRQAATLNKMIELVGTDEGLTDEERSWMPDYFAERLGLMIGRDKEDNPLIVSGMGLPVEEISKLWSITPKNTWNAWFEMLTPILKTPMELMFNHSSFTNRAITDPSFQNYLRTTYPIWAQVPGVREWLQVEKQTVETKDGPKDFFRADPQRMYILTAALGRLYWSVGKATDDRKGLAERFLNLMTGTKVSSMDVKRAAQVQIKGEWGPVQQRVLDERGDQLEKTARMVESAQGPENQVLARKAYRKARGDIFADARYKLDSYQAMQMAEQGLAQDPAKMAAYKSLLDPVELALDGYYGIDPDDAAFADAFGQPNWSKFYSARDAYLEGLDPQTRAAVKAKMSAYIDRLPATAKKLEAQYQSSLAAYRQYMTLQPFAVRVSSDDLEKMRHLNAQYMAAGDTMGRNRFMNQLPGSDRVLLRRYHAIKVNPSRERQRFEKQHPELQQWGFIS